MTNINSGILPIELWRSRQGAFGPRVSFLGTSVPGAGSGTGPCATGAFPIPHVRVKAVPAGPGLGVPAAQLQPNNYMTSVGADGVSKAGPPPDREPA